MTGTACFQAALGLLGETPDSGIYYEQFALGALNQLLANSLREINAVRAAQGEGAAEPDGIVRALRLLGAYFSFQVGAELPELPEYLRLLRG